MSPGSRLVEARPEGGVVNESHVTGDEGSVDPVGDWDGHPVEQVRALFVTLGKAVRAFQLYDGNNPVRKRFVDALREEFERLWGEVDGLVVSVDEDRLSLDGHEVYAADNRNDSLAFLFFKDGVRELTFLPGIERDELERFLGVLQRARKLVPEGDDLLTILWEEELEFLKYRYIDLLAEGVALPEPGEGVSGERLQAALAAEDEEIAAQEEAAETGDPAAAAPAQTVNKDDFNPTLYALDPAEMEALRVELKKELGRDIRADVLKALFDRLEEPEHRERQSEVLGILETLLPNFLSRGGLVVATNLLRELRRLEEAPGVFDEPRLDRSRRIVDAISEPEPLHELIRALYLGTIRASPVQLAAFLGFLRGRALEPLLRESETVEHKQLQAVLREAVRGVAGQNRSHLVSLLDSPDPVVVAAAARLVGQMKVSEGAVKLASVLQHPDASVRLAGIEAAIAIRASTVATSLQANLEDEDRSVRIAAAKGLGTLRYRPAAQALADIVEGKRIRQSDIAEKVAVFEAYGLTAGEAGVKVLDNLLNKRGLFGKREASELRAAAALGLGRIDAVAARSALESALQDDDPVVRSNVNRALRSGD